ncbi:GNAT family acetyltransferase [Heyndrickxia shackletonii]|uniref:GNAT family acetyltransferase n=1 Tax=Heyndrickxia shackletonii TaxID=157838 RepID=A0A0Q3TJ31_9BACI|nr:GNAT family N-acetyltransferase [Heyndrickxia shackletonii]KQL53960.1 GNAT family acetyltransferase [Heyndrickxia shackletonii]NEY97754.1 GNAT family N-acetyltransferase [Heyndrickxia shackletonii]
MMRKGKMEDVPAIMKMVRETVEIMREEHNDQWDEAYPTATIFETDVQNGTLFVLEDEGNVIGSITVDQNQPVEYKLIPWRKEGSSFIFHRLVVNPHSRGKGEATKLIKFAEQYAIDNQIPYMRIDTYSLNKKAQKLFEKNGYIKVGEMPYHGKTRPYFCYDKFL